MTTQEVSNVLAYCEAHCDNIDELDVVRWVAEKFAESLYRDEWRRRQFMRDALPMVARDLASTE